MRFNHLVVGADDAFGLILGPQHKCEFAEIMISRLYDRVMGQQAKRTTMNDTGAFPQ